jgi:hypothetical protein
MDDHRLTAHLRRLLHPERERWLLAARPRADGGWSTPCAPCRRPLWCCVTAAFAGCAGWRPVKSSIRPLACASSRLSWAPRGATAPRGAASGGGHLMNVLSCQTPAHLTQRQDLRQYTMPLE